MPKKQPKKRRLWLNDGNLVRLRAEYKNHVWSYDFVEDRTMDGKKIRFLNIIDEAERRCVASIPRRSWRNHDVIEALANAMLLHGTPEYLRSDNGTEFTANQNHQLNWWYAPTLKGYNTGNLSRGIEKSANRRFFSGCC